MSKEFKDLLCRPFVDCLAEAPEKYRRRGGWRTVRCELANFAEHELMPMAEKEEKWKWDHPDEYQRIRCLEPIALSHYSARHAIEIYTSRQETYGQGIDEGYFSRAKTIAKALEILKETRIDNIFISEHHDVDAPEKLDGRRVGETRQEGGGYQKPLSPCHVRFSGCQKTGRRPHDYPRVNGSSTSIWSSRQGYEKVNTSWYTKSWTEMVDAMGSLNELGAPAEFG